MRNAIFITVRTDSSRLPNKALLPILGRPVIELVILRAKQVKNADLVIVCTTKRRIDDKVTEIAQRNGVEYFRGDVRDKLARWLGAAKKFSVDNFVTMDGDDLLCEPELVEGAISQISSGGVDFIEAPDGLICGAFTYGIKKSALEKVCSIKDSRDTEMMWVYFKETKLFKTTHLDINDPVFFDDSIRMTLDYPQDLDFFKAIFTHFNCKDNNISLREIVPFLKSHPEIIKINSFRLRDWADNQKKKTKLLLKAKGLPCL